MTTTTRALENEFPAVKGFATRANAERALAKAVAADFFSGGRVLTTVVQRPTDSRFIPVMIIGSNCGGFIAGPTRFNVCVTN